MTTIKYSQPRGSFFNVLSDGKFHTTVPEGTEGSVKREYETSDGKKGVKNELVAESISGIISNISVWDRDYGKTIQVTLGELGKDGIILSLSSNSSFGEDFMKKLPNLDIDKEVKFAPYSFEDSTGRKKKGMTLYQDDKKIESYYLKTTTDKKGVVKRETVNGYPEVPKEAKNWDSDDWKLYFAQARKFLLGELKKSKLYDITTLVPESKVTYPTEKNQLDEMQF